MKHKAKNFLITFLVILAIYQTLFLWFENFSSHSFFYTLKNKITLANPKKNLDSTIENIIINLGTEKFLKQYNDILNYEYKNTFDQAIFECLKNGKYLYEKNFDFNYVLNNKSAIYNFSYLFNQKDLIEIFGLNFKNIPKNAEFDSIILVPNSFPPTTIKTILYNTNTNEAHIFKLNKPNLTENVYYTLDNFSYFENKILYNISSKKNGINLFKKNQFIPKLKEESSFINKIYFNNPIEQDGGILLSGLEKYIDIFFSNHPIKWDTEINNTYTYKDDNTIVKYYPNNILEYINYNTSTIKELSPYTIALDFLKKDINIKNEYYLKDYKKIDNEYIFYFDYKINNFPIILSDNLKNKTKMNSMIEITVSENKVYKYKRIIYDFYIYKEKSNWNVPFLYALDKIFEKRKSKNLIINNVDEIDLIYFFNEENEIDLKWQIKMGNETYFENIEENN